MAPNQGQLNLEIASGRSAKERLAAADSARSHETKMPEEPSGSHSVTANFEEYGNVRRGAEITVRVPLGGAFGRYQLKSILGKGGMGEVHLAYDSMLERNVALKAPRLADNSPIYRERFLREARAAAALDHPNICPIHDVGEIDGQLYLTMAYVDGASLSEYLREHGRLDPDHAVRLTEKVAVAMQQAHERGLLHRDLKPGNILLTKKGEPIVTDFGLAFRFDTQTSDRITESGLMIGTPTYMPPEQINAQELGPTADVYSLGVVFYQLLTGKTPFTGPLGKLIAQIESAPPPPPSELCPGLDPKLEAICLQALAKAPAERQPDMATLAKQLHDYAEAKRERLLREQATAALQEKMRRRVAALVGTMVLAVAATATAAVLMMRREEPVIEPVPQMQLSDADRLFEALVKPLLKIDCVLDEDKVMPLGRKLLPPSVFLVPTDDGQKKLHNGPLYFSLSGTGLGHVLDFSDQPGQAGQITNFGGEVTVTAPYLFFLGNMTASSRIYIKGGIGYSILAPMNGGSGCRHVEFDGTHFLMPKLGTPKIDTTKATGAERATLRNPELIDKTVWSYEKTEYVIYNRPGTQVVPGDHEVRKKQFPAVYDIIEADRKRQTTALTISNVRFQDALRAAAKGN